VIPQSAGVFGRRDGRLSACLVAFWRGRGPWGPEQLIKMASGQLPDACGMSVAIGWRLPAASVKPAIPSRWRRSWVRPARHLVKFTSGGATFRPDRLGEGIDSNTLHEGYVSDERVVAHRLTRPQRRIDRSGSRYRRNATRANSADSLLQGEVARLLRRCVAAHSRAGVRSWAVAGVPAPPWPRAAAVEPWCFVPRCQRGSSARRGR
jgi:hypothetical protein